MIDDNCCLQVASRYVCAKIARARVKLAACKTLAKVQSLPYFFAADGKRENGTLCCGLPSGT